MGQGAAMGLGRDVIQILLRQHRRRRFAGPVLTLGVQDVVAGYDELRQWAKRDGVPFADVPPAERELSGSRLWCGPGRKHPGYVHARTFFRTLGIPAYDDLDFSD